MIQNLVKLDSFSIETLPKKTRHYLLLEGGLNHRLLDETREIYFPSMKRWVYENTDLDDQKERGPLLVETDSGSVFLDYFARKTIKKHWGVIISSNAEMAILLKHLRQLRYANIPSIQDQDAQQKILFRWYEPRALLGLFPRMTKEENTLFMGPMSCLTWHEWAYDQGIWYQFKRQSMDDDTTQLNAPFLISDPVIESLEQQDFDYFTKVLFQELVEQYPQVLKWGTESQLLNAVRAETDLAMQQNINQRNAIKEHLIHRLKKK